MNKALINSLTAAEQRFVDETSREALANLDEDQVLELFARARRMRDKHVSTYRRGAGAKVAEKGGRGAGYAENQRARDKAEVFEGVLAQVSRRLGVLAAASAAELRAERMEAARATRASGPAAAAPRAAAAPAGRRPAAKKTTGGVKKDASSRAMGARRQAKRDAR
ncbi:MAG: hypothetical protein FWE71_09975 [Nocardioidaceae bacterium]|nr:hypothetical protein [Nocardioidaceae bacterium]MCL2613665.1 hypothetical protein [Nocardioidaceae bacterium]